MFTNLDKQKRKKKEFKVYILVCFVLVVSTIGILISNLGETLYAASNFTWDFEDESEYSLSNEDKIQLNNGEVSLPYIENTIQYNSSSKFNQGEYNNTQLTGNSLTLGDTPITNPTNTANLYSQWEFENNATDPIRSKSGLLRGNAHYVTDGNQKIGSYAVNFDGSGDYIIITDSTTSPTTYTYSIWVNPATATNINIFSKTNSSPTANASHQLRINSSGKFEHYTVDGGGGKTVTGVTTVTTGQWYYVTITAKENDYMRLYVNGKEEGTPTAIGTPVGGGSSYNAYNIGGNSISSLGWFNGNLDEFEIYSAELSSNQIYSMYLKQSAKYGEYTSNIYDTGAVDGGDFSNLSWNTSYPTGKSLPENKAIETSYAAGNIDMSSNILLYKFEDSVNDLSGNSYNGTIVSSTSYITDSITGDKSIDFTGGYVRLPTSVRVANPTVSFWIKPNANNIVIFSEGGSANLGVNYENNKFKINFGTSNVGNTGYFSSFTSSVNQWHHVAVTYDGTSLKAYIDGQLGVNASVTGSISYSGDIDYVIGTYCYSNGNCHNTHRSSIDEFAIFNTPLSETTIQNIYKRGVGNVKYQIRTCDDNACSGENFIGNDGTSNSYFSEANNTTNTPPSLDISSLSNNRYIQFKAYITTLNNSVKPEISSINTIYEAYPVDKPYIKNALEKDLTSRPISLDLLCEGTLDGGGDCTSNSTKPSGTEIYYQICNDTIENCDSNSTWKYWDGSNWSNAEEDEYNNITEINTHLSDLSLNSRYFGFKTFLSSQGGATPTLSDLALKVTLDTTDPVSNGSNIRITAKSSGDWIKTKPLMEWTAGEDDENGIGLLGYCIAIDESDLNSSQSLNPQISAGILQGFDDGVSETYCPYIVSGTSINLNSISGLNLTTNKQYNISIKAVDYSGNIWSGNDEDYLDLYTFKFDNTTPVNPAYISMPSNFIKTKDITITWPVGNSDAASDVGSGLAGLQYKIGQAGTWYGDLHNGSQDVSDVLVNDGAYTTNEDYDYPNLIDGNNVIYIRAIDNAGNVASSYVTGVLKINTTAPDSPQNLSVDPSDNTSNSYSFSWTSPSSFIGDENKLTYCYTVNTLPSAQTCTFTGEGITSLSADAFASQPGNNTFYVVARDEALNINYETYTSITFTYSGEAPGIPLNVDVSDISTKETSDWKLAVTWAAPTNTGAGVSNYKVYRSENQNAVCSSNINNFSLVSTVLGTSYIDTNLEQKDYYYCVRSCDSANNCSAVSATASEYPTGKYTEPADLVSEPTVNATTTRKAVISWSTDRRSDSKIQLGLKTNDYFEAESAISAQVTAHTITLDNLVAGTTYYYRAKWTDEDGNTGISEEKTFTTSPAPIIKDAKVINIGIDSAIVQFTSNSANKVKIYYGQTTGFGGIEEVETSFNESSYTTLISNLNDNTRYYYKINPMDAEGFEYEGTVLDFTTLPRPTVSNIQIEEVKGSAQPTVNVSWDSNTDITSIVSYYPQSNPQDVLNEVDINPTTSHKTSLTGLLPSTKYELVVKGVDSIGNEAVSDTYQFTTATDTRPPLISNIKVDSVITSSDSDNNAQLIISWNTDELSSSQVEYAEGSSGSYNLSTQIDNDLDLKHVVVISGLRPSNIYHLRVVSSDSAKNNSSSSNIVTITPKRSENALELVLSGLSDIFKFLL